MRNESEFIDDNCWDAIWDAPVQQRVRAFLWLVYHDRLLGNLIRYRRRMTNNPKCYVCDAEEESVLHILRDCPAARMVWRKLGGPSHKTEFFTSTLKQWIAENICAGNAQNAEL